MEPVNIFISKPVIIDVEEADITPINPDEIYVQHPVHTKYAISNYGRVYSIKRKHLLKEQYMKDKTNPFVRLPDKLKRFGTYKISRLVADIFCQNNYPDNAIVFVHHLDGNQQNNMYTNLVWISPSDHSLVHFGIPVYHYELASGKLVEFPGVSVLSKYLNIDKQRIYRAIKNNAPICTLDDGEIYIIALNRLRDSAGHAYYIGYRKADKAEIINEDDSFLEFIEGLLEGFADG